MNTPDLVLSRKDVDRMKRDIYGFIDTFPTRRTKKRIMEYAAGKRRIITGPRKGLYDPMFTPWWIEVTDNMSVNSTINKSISVKSVQSGSTTAMENGINYYIKEEPADQLYLSGTQELLKRWVETNLDPSIRNFGNDQYIKIIDQGKNKKKTGDLNFRKAYFGCFLDMVSARSGSSLRQLTKQINWLDEIDSAPRALTTGEGSFLDVVEGRVSSFGMRGKTYISSTPTTADSAIWNEFLKGDRRYFLVPCPICGSFQALEFGDDYSEFGLKGEIDDNNRVIECYYLCRDCGEQIDSNNKTMMLENGFWQPTAISDSEYTRSYSINSLYSPIGMGFDWPDLFKMWQAAKSDRTKLISFTNLYQGLPFEDDGEDVKVDDIIYMESGYKAGEIPADVLFLTSSADVQRGSKRDKKNPPRIELKLVGHGWQYKTWSILYKVFYGEVMDPHGGAWQQFYEWCLNTNMAFTGLNGARYSSVMNLVDSGDYSGKGVGTEIVYSFCKRLRNFYPSKGFRKLKLKPGDRYESDIRGEADKVKYRVAKVGADNTLIEISTVHYKDTFYSRLQIPRIPGDKQKSGFCDFPSDYPREVFEMLTAETKNLEDGSYSAHGRRNEALDCMVGCLAGADVFLDSSVDKVRKNLIKGGMSPMVAEKKIRTPFILKKIEEGIRKQIG